MSPAANARADSIGRNLAVMRAHRQRVALHEDGTITAWGDDAFAKTAAPPGQGHTAIAAGGSHNLALENPPPLGAAVTITVKVAAVPGEEKTDNNEATFTAIFSR